MRARSSLEAPSLCRKTVLVTLAALAVVYMAFFAYLETRNPLTVNARVPKKKKEFVFPLSRYLMNSFVRQGTVFFLFDTEIKEFEISVPGSEPTGGPEKGTAGGPSGREEILPVLRSAGGDKFRLAAREDMMNWVVRCAPGDAQPVLNVRIVLAPRLSARLLIFQTLLAFCFLAGIFSLGVLAAGAFSGKAGWVDSGIRDFMSSFFAVCVIFWAYFAVRPAALLSLLKRMSALFPDILLTNLALALPLAGLYLFFKKARIRLVYLPLILGILYAAFWPDYRLDLCGDADQWANLILPDIKHLYFAEFLSFGSAKGVYAVLKGFFPGLPPHAALTVTGKLAGTGFLFSIYALARAFAPAARDRQMLFMLLASGLTLNVFFLGYPEFAYYPLPFLVLSALFSLKYLEPGGGMTPLILAAVFLALAGLSHGSAFSCLPAILALPLLKHGGLFRREKRLSILAGCAGVLLAVFLIVFLALQLSSLLGFVNDFQNYKGGGDDDRLVEFLPPRSAGAAGSVFLEIRYLGMRGWAIITALPVLLLIMAVKAARRETFSNLDRVLFLMGACQAIFLFTWSFDLGFRDFDLYIVPLTFPALLLIKKALEGLNLETSTLGGLAAVFLFALTGHWGTVLLITSPLRF